MFRLTGWSPLIQTRFHVSRPTLDPAVSSFPSLTGLSPSLAGFPKTVLLETWNHLCGPYPGVARTPVWPPPRSLAATCGIDVSFFSSGYLDVSVRRVPLRTLWIHVRMHEGSSCGFPHSDTHGSKGICPSPWLFAACRVFLRLLVPRHPPCALISLTCLRFRSGCIALQPPGSLVLPSALYALPALLFLCFLLCCIYYKVMNLPCGHGFHTL